MAAVTDAATRPVRGVRPIDRLFLAYLLVNTTMVLARAGAVPTWPLLLAVNAAATLVPLFAARAPRSALADFLGGTYPLLLAPAFYTQLGLMTGAHGVLHDPAIQRLEAALFGAQPSLTWHDRMSGTLVAERALEQPGFGRWE